ncbi:MAG: YncE family protein [Thermoplasmata archaeon]
MLRRSRSALAAAIALLVVSGTLLAIGLLSHPLPGPAAPRTGPYPVLDSSSPPQPVGSTTVIGVVATPTVGYFPTALLEDPRTGWIYVANEISSNVTVLNGTLSIGNVPVGTGPSGLAYDDANGEVYVTNENASTVTIIDFTTAVATVSVGLSPVSPVYDAADGYVYVPDYASSSVTILENRSVIANLTVGAAPTSAVYDPADGYVYVTSEQSGLEAILSGTTLLESLPIHLSDAFDTVYDPFSGVVYVINGTSQIAKFGGPGTGYACLISGLTLLRSVDIGPGPGYGAVAAVDPVNGWLYVPDGTTDVVTVVNGSSVVGIVPVGATPEFAQFDPANGFVLVADQLGDTVTVMNGSTVAANPPVGTYPYALTYDPLNRLMYVGNLGSSTVSAIGNVSGFLVTFEETGLRSGTSWSVTFQGVGRSSVGSTIDFYEPNGSYAYLVNSVPGYTTESATSGIQLVDPSGAVVSVSFLAVTPPSPPPPPFPWTTVLVGIGVAAVALVAVWAVFRGRSQRNERIGRI